ncbi:MAG: response regulator [Pseudomonadota bacterium]
MGEKTRFCILVIDDDEAIRDSCSQVLARDGYRAESAKDGAEGLEKAREFKPDIVLVDLKMPGMSGMDVILKLQEIDRNIIPIVITGYASVESAVEAMKRGAYDFLPKPFPPDRLRIVIDKAVEKRGYLLEIKALKQQKKLVEESFVAMVSHQLRSPIAAVRQHLQAIQDGSLGAVNVEQNKTIERVTDRLDSLMHIIDDWLDLSSINKGKVISGPADVDLIGLLASLVEFMQPLAEARKVTMSISYPPAFPPVRGNRASIEQVFANLINNAIIYNRPFGSVFITFRDRGRRLSVDVSDTGMGIEREYLPFLFDEFSPMLPRGRKDGGRPKGSGLGLAIARRIVEAHGGSIEVDTVPDKGSTFKVTFPKHGATPTDL